MREAEAAQVAHRVRPARARRVIVSIGMVDYPSLPAPARWTRDSHDDAAEVALEAWIREWWGARGWFSGAVLSPDVGEYDGAKPDARRSRAVLRAIFARETRRGLSPDPRFSAFTCWGDQDAARAWLREKARAAGVPSWERL